MQFYELQEARFIILLGSRSTFVPLAIETAGKGSQPALSPATMRIAGAVRKLEQTCDPRNLLRAWLP
jgi:hypothetical protein